MFHACTVRRLQVVVHRPEPVGKREIGLRKHFLVDLRERDERRQRRAQQQLSRFEADAGLEPERLAEARVVPRVRREHVGALVVVGQRVAAADHAVDAGAEQPREETVLGIRRPGEAGIRCEVVGIELDRVLAAADDRVGDSVQLAGLEQRRRRTEQIGFVREVRVRELAERGAAELVAKAVVQCEVRIDSPLVLRVDAAHFRGGPVLAIHLVGGPEACPDRGCVRSSPRPHGRSGPRRACARWRDRHSGCRASSSR